MKTVGIVIDLMPPEQIWCDRCMTSAAWRCEGFILGALGVSKVLSVTKCTTCDREGDE